MYTSIHTRRRFETQHVHLHLDGLRLSSLGHTHLDGRRQSHHDYIPLWSKTVSSSSCTFGWSIKDRYIFLVYFGWSKTVTS